jgi:hypothetical protein
MLMWGQPPSAVRRAQLDAFLSKLTLRTRARHPHFLNLPTKYNTTVNTTLTTTDVAKGT